MEQENKCVKYNTLEAARKTIQQLFQALHQRDVEIEELTTSLRQVIASNNMLNIKVQSLNSCIDSNNKKVTNLENKLHEAKSKFAESEKKLEMSSEKIDGLRLVIQDLMAHAQTQAEREQTLNRHVQELEVVVIARTTEQEELIRASEKNNHAISHLQAQLDNKIQEIEALNLSSSSTSQQTEVPPPKQINMTLLSDQQKNPLDKLLGLEESLTKYFQVEDKMIKKVKDLEEKKNELLLQQEYLLESTSKQQLQIESLRTKLEQKRWNEPDAYRQTILRLTSQISELSNKREFDKQVLYYQNVELNGIKARLERVSSTLAGKETELLKVSQSKNEAMGKLRDEISILTSSLSEKDNEIFCQQEHLKEKENIIQIMTDDSKSLHRSLVMIHAKIKKSGNILDLRKKLKDERRKNAKLLNIIMMLKTDLEMNTLRPRNT